MQIAWQDIDMPIHSALAMLLILVGLGFDESGIRPR